MNHPFQKTQVEARAKVWDPSTPLPAADGNSDAIPLLADKTTGRLLVDIGSSVQLDNLNVNTDQIESKQDTTNAILTTTAADLAAVKTQLATGTIAVTGGGGGGGGSSSFSIPAFTSKSFGYTGSNLTTITYYNGATRVAQRTFAYSGSNISSDTLTIP